MKRSIIILLVTFQCIKSIEIVPMESNLDETEMYVDLSMSDSENDSSIEELRLTTLNYDTKTEATPPINSPSTLSTFQDSALESNDKYFDTEITESPAIVLESSEVVEDHSQVNTKKSKAVKGRLLDSNSSEFPTKPDRLDETPPILLEDTTVADIDSESNETNIDVVDGYTTIKPRTSQKPRNLIYKTRPNILLRYYVEDSHLRSPIAALIDKKANPLSKSKKLWKAALKPNSLLDIMVVSYDSEGIKSTYNLTNTKTMIATLDRVREENATTQESKTYYSIIRTGQLIPYDSAIFLSTDNLPSDTEHQQPASMILLKKRIRLYLVIFDDKSHVMNETSSTVVRQTGFLGQLALRTGGDIIYVPNYAFRPDGEMESVTLIVANRLKPIDSELQEVKENELKNENIDLALENLKLSV